MIVLNHKEALTTSSGIYDRHCTFVHCTIFLNKQGDRSQLLFYTLIMDKLRKIRINDEEKEARPFFIIVAAVMLFLYGLTLYTRTDLQKAPEVVIFSIMMGTHAVLHWFYRVFSRDRAQVLIYFYIQTVLAAILVLYSKELSLVFGLFLPLLGEEVGVFRSKKAVIISILANSALIVGALLLYFNTQSFDPLIFAGIVPLVFFVIIYVNLYNRQSDAKIRAESLLKELEMVNSKLRESNAQIEKLTIDQERQRIARELHDTLAQGLSGLILQLEAASEHLKNQNNDKAGNIIIKAMATARETLAGSREAIDGLRGSPEGMSMLLFLESQKVIFDGVRMRFSYKADKEPVLDESQRSHFEKIITEALSNCLRHSDADNVRLELSCVGSGSDELRLLISDDGKGFDAEKVPDGHYGLTGIRERCGMLGGILSLKSAAGQGTILRVEVPNIIFKKEGFIGGGDG